MNKLIILPVLFAAAPTSIAPQQVLAAGMNVAAILPQPAVFGLRKAASDFIQLPLAA